MKNEIVIRGAREHNLKNIDILKLNVRHFRFLFLSFSE